MTSSNPQLLPLPNVFNLKLLFERPCGQDGKPLGDHLGAHAEAHGLLRGSSVLVTGRPGTGKSFLAMSLIWEHMKAIGWKPEGGWGQTSHLLYIGVQTDEIKVLERARSFGWFPREWEGGPELRVISVNETDLPQPTLGAEEVINPIITKLRKYVAPPNKPADNVFVLFDTITALVKGSESTGARQRHMQELMAVTKSMLGPKKALCVLVADTTDTPDDPFTLEKEVVVDYVFHLSYRDTGGGRVGRVLDIRKSQQVNPLRLGQHSWALVRDDTADAIFAPEELRAERKKHHLQPWGGNVPPSARWAEASILPHPLPHPIGQLQDPEWEAEGLNTVDMAAKKRLSCGVPGLDQMLKRNPEYWSRPVRQILEHSFPNPLPNEDSSDWAQSEFGLIQGSTTFLVGRAGTGKSNCCLQFLLANPNMERSLYVNFENRPHRVLELYPGSRDKRIRLKKCQRLFHPRSNLDINLLLNEIYWIITKHYIDRITIDGMSDLMTFLEGKEYDQFVEAIIHTVRQANLYLRRQKNSKLPLVTIFISLEADPDALSLNQFALRDSPADNVVVFRQVAINDERRKTVEVRKSRGQSPDKQVRELVVLPGNHYPLRVIPGLDNYTGLPTNRPKPVRVALQLVGENAAEVECNKRLAAQLKKAFGYEIKEYRFSREELVRTLLDIGSGTDRLPFSDIKLLHVDEWWVRELRVKAIRSAREALAQTTHPLLRLNHFLATDRLPEDMNAAKGRYTPLKNEFWAIEMEKVCIPMIRDRAPTASAEIVALPHYCDYGLFCVNTNPIPPGPKPTGELPVQTVQGPKTWVEWLDIIPRVWAVAENEWFQAPQAGGTRHATIVDYLRASLDKRPTIGKEKAIGFSYDMDIPATAACVFLELCWAFGAPEHAFVHAVGEYAGLGTDNEKQEYIASHPITQAFRLLMFLVAEGLMPSRTSLGDAQRSVLCRHWYSSLTAEGEDEKEDEDERPRPESDSSRDKAGKTPAFNDRFIPLPFFPLGAVVKGEPVQTSKPVRTCLADAIGRFDRLLGRLKAVVAYRKDLIPSHGAKNPTAGDRLTNLVAIIRHKFEQLIPAYPNPTDKSLSKLHKSDFRNIIFLLKNFGSRIRKTVQRSRFFPHGRAFERSDITTVGFNPRYLESPPPEDPERWQHLPYAMFMDSRDVIEFLNWHNFRLQLLEAATQTGQGLGELLGGKPAGKSPDWSRVEAVTGFSCEGAWTVGVSHTTRSPGLAANVLTEITSPESTTKRADLGAGIPARKEFFETHGHQPVPQIPNDEQTWKQFLLHLGSRSRRRSRAFCARVRVSAAFTEINSRVFHALTLASEQQAAYRKNRKRVAKLLAAHAAAAIGEIFEWVRLEMQDAHRQDHNAWTIRVSSQQPPGVSTWQPQCVTCTHRPYCQKVYTQTVQNSAPPAGGPPS